MKTTAQRHWSIALLVSMLGAAAVYTHVEQQEQEHQAHQRTTLAYLSTNTAHNLHDRLERLTTDSNALSTLLQPRADTSPPQALANTGLEQLPHMGYHYRLSYQTSNGHIHTVAASTPAPPPSVWQQALHTPLQLPGGHWTLSTAPQQGWYQRIHTEFHIMGWLASLLLGYLTKLLLDLRVQRQSLRAEIQAQTADIQATQYQLQATLEAIPDLMLELDAQGHLLQLHSQASHPLQPAWPDCAGQPITALLPPEASAAMMAALHDAHTTGHSQGREYPLHLPNQKLRWFELSGTLKAGNPLDPVSHVILLARDITTRKRAEEQLKLASHFFEGSSEGFVITDAHQRIIKVNRTFTQITGYSVEEMLGKSPAALSSGRHSRSFYRQMWQQINAVGQWQGEVWNRRKNGEVYPEWLSITRVPDAQGQTAYYLAIFSDTSQRKEQEARIRYLAYYDPLTGLANRSLLKDRAQHDLAQCKRHQTPLSLLFIDLDHFKQINDSLGHQVGDQLLKQVGERLGQQVREQDTVARMGGDEFVTVLPETNDEGAALVARNFLERLSQPYQVGPHELTVTPSIGIALYPNDGTDFDTLYRCADIAMYRAKQNGRSSFSFFTTEMQAQSVRRLQIENALRRALERDQLWLQYQPQMSLRNHQLIGMEVLLRWNHPEWGPVSPAEFIPVAENSRQILAIGEWVLRTATAQAKAWQDQGLPPIIMAINLSAVQFRQPDLPDLVGTILHDTGLAPEWLELELTESVAMHDPEGAIATMQQLHQRGVRMSVDDFGTGYSSLNYLKRFQIYKLKIDQSFVRDVTRSPEDARIVEAIVQMAESMGLTTIAEGVETPEQLEFLRSHGCREIQGYHLSRPLSATDFEAFVRQYQPTYPNRTQA
ncbi:MAG: putative bifunctional diguanylate cyclase/phosphodiesterase [Macromonas sp.]